MRKELLSYFADFVKTRFAEKILQHDRPGLSSFCLITREP